MKELTLSSGKVVKVHMSFKALCDLETDFKINMFAKPEESPSVIRAMIDVALRKSLPNKEERELLIDDLSLGDLKSINEEIGEQLKSAV